MGLFKVAAKHTPRLKVKFITKGICYADNGIIVVRKPYSRANLFEYLHECAHVVLGHLNGSGTRYNEEYEADCYVRRVFMAEGLKVPKNTDKRQRAYIGECIHNALMHGAKTIEPEPYKYAFGVDFS